MSLALIQTNQVLVHQGVIAAHGVSPGKFYQDQFVAVADADGIEAALAAIVSNLTETTLVTNIATNLNLADDALVNSWLTSLVDTFGKGGALKVLFDTMAATPTDNQYYSTVDTFNKQTVLSIDHSSVAGSSQSAAAIGEAALSPNQAIALTTALNNAVGGVGDDTISGSATTLNAGDTINGGDGLDTLSISDATGSTFAGFTGIGLERVEVSASANSTVNMAGVSGETTLVARGSSANVAFTNQDAIVDLEASGNASGNVTLTYLASTVNGSADSQNITFSNTTNGTVTVDGVETLNVTALGESTITQLDGADATVLNISGAGDLTLSNVETSMVTISAADMTGALDITLGTADITLTGGSGNDTFTFAATLNKSDTVTGGDGVDTLELDLATTLTATDTHTVTGVETLALTSAANGVIDFDAFSAPSAFTSVVATSDLDAEDVTLTDIPAGIAITVQNTNAGTAKNDIDNFVIDLKDGTGTADSVALTVINKQDGTGTNTEAFTITTLQMNAIETMTLDLQKQSSAGTAEDIDIGTWTAGALTTVTVTGAADFAASAPATVTTYDASAATGAHSITFTGTKDVTVTTGSGADIIALGTTYTDNDTINGGDGNDTFTFTQANGADDRVRLTSVESITLTGPSAATSNSSTLDLKDADSVTSITLVNAEGDITVDNILATLTTINLDGSSAAGTAGVLTFNMDDDTSADSITIETQQDGTGYIGDIIGNDFETVNLVFDYDDAITGATANDTMVNLTFTDATSLVISVQDPQDVATAELQFAGLIDLKAAGATVDLTGADINLGIVSTNLNKASTNSAISATTLGGAFLADAALTFDSSDQITVLLSDGRDTAAADDTVLMFTDASGATADGLNVTTTSVFNDDDIDIIRFVDDGSSVKDIGNVYVGGFQDRTTFGATTADKIDFSALGVTGLSDLTITAGTASTALKITQISDARSTDAFSGTIVLVGTDATKLTADNFIFA